jgi:hypothetical protein
MEDKLINVPRAAGSSLRGRLTKSVSQDTSKLRYGDTEGHVADRRRVSYGMAANGSDNVLIDQIMTYSPSSLTSQYSIYLFIAAAKATLESPFRHRVRCEISRFSSSCPIASMGLASPRKRWQHAPRHARRRHRHPHRDQRRLGASATRSAPAARNGGLTGIMHMGTVAVFRRVWPFSILLSMPSTRRSSCRV